MCPAGKDYIADRRTRTCYRAELSEKPWAVARDACATNGEMLVVLEPVVKAQFIKDSLSANIGKQRWEGAGSGLGGGGDTTSEMLVWC